MATGIKDKVAILGMGCSKFGERWDNERRGPDGRGLRGGPRRCRHRNEADRGRLVRHRHRRAAVGKSAIPLADGAAAAQHPGDAGREFLRQRAPRPSAAPSTPWPPARPTSPWRSASRSSRTPGTAGCRSAAAAARSTICGAPNCSAPGTFAQLAAAYRASTVSSPRTSSGRWRTSRQEPRQRREEPEGPPAQGRSRSRPVLNAPMIAEPLGLFDCCGVSDGAACAIVTTPEIARSLGKKDIVSVKALQLASRTASRRSTTPGTAATSSRPASPPSAPTTRPGSRIRARSSSLIEVHDCFSITELVTMEDLGISRRGRRRQRRARRLLRRRRQDPLPDRRRPQVLRPPDRRLGPADDLRDVSAASGPRRRAPAEGRATLRPHPQPRRLPPAQRRRHLHRRQIWNVR